MMPPSLRWIQLFCVIQINYVQGAGSCAQNQACPGGTVGCICNGCDSMGNCINCSQFHCFNSQIPTTIGNQCITTTCLTCTLGYYYDAGTTTCHPCPSPCFQCDTPFYCSNGQCPDPCTSCDTTGCLSCQDGSIPVGGLCTISTIPCDPNCQTCDSTIGACSVCNGGYYLDANVCFVCDIGCAICTGSASYCSTCIALYTNYNSSCFQCTSPCVTCDTSPTSCTSCIAGLGIDGNTCQCSPPCLTCSTTKHSCTLCVNNTYVLDTLHESCCQLPCTSCSSSACLNCSDGYYLASNSICQNCQSPCFNCQINQSTCLSCIANYTYYNNTCFQCTPPCATCDTSSTHCVTYIVESTLMCNSPCFTCQTTPDTCLTCQTGYQYSNGQCLCNSPCATCINSPNTCLSCIINYQYSNNSCFQCQTPCLTCSQSPSQCTSCIVGYDLQLTNCVLSTSNLIIICPNGTYKSNNQCLQCQYPCQTCSQAQNCLSCVNEQNRQSNCKCNDHYFDDGNNCSPCLSPCGQCIGQSIYCLTCKGNNVSVVSGACIADSGYIMQNGLSVKCSNDCHQCEVNIDYCTSCSFNQTLLQNGQCNCISTYYLAQPQQCLPCQIPCLTCSINKCLTCLPSYYLIGSQCQPCPMGCDTCLDSNTCTICSPGYQTINHVNLQKKDCNQMSSETVQYTEYAIQLTSYLLWILLGLFIFGFLNGGLGMFYNIMDLLQLVSYLQYINTVLPYNLKAYLRLFKFAQMQFITEYLNVEEFVNQFVDQNDIPQGPQKIMDDGYTVLTIINFTSFVTVWALFFAIYLICRFAPSQLDKIGISLENSDKNFILKLKIFIITLKRYILKLSVFITSEFFYSGLLRMHFSIAYDYCFFALLNLSSTSLDGQANALLQISSYLALIQAAIYLIVFARCTYVLDRPIINFKLTYFKKQYGSLIEGFRKNQFTLYFNVFQLFKKLVIMFTLIFCYYEPIYQITNIILLELVEMIYLVLLNPIIEQYEKKKEFLCDTFIFLTEITLFILVLDDYVSNVTIHRVLVGWITIISITLMLLCQIIIDFQQQWKMYIKIAKRIQQCMSSLFNGQSSSNYQLRMQIPIFIG